ncbi:chloramphenical resistance permease RarD [Endozoicomonas sp. (ex Bugula neritina AB1)]|nr:chloramphenical resistance permease RarD [Endozoicomonas sp. (ex Bugula neritina AB1)]
MLCAFGAFCLWGFIPVYFKTLDAVPPLEVLGHRAIWSSLLLILVMAVTGKLKDMLAVMKHPKMMGMLVLSSALIATNWGVFIWGVVNDRILETSLGYYINPLINVCFGFLFLGERLNRTQSLAIGLAVVAVCLQIYQLGSVPWVAFVLAFSFGFYGLVRKQLNVPAATGLAVETLVMLPMALGYLYWLWQNNANSFRLDTPDPSVLLMMAGVFTTVPLILFNLAARRLSLTVLGVMQYLGPSISFAVGVLVYNEPLGQEQIQTFSLIWLALAIFTADGVYRQKKAL